MLNIIDMCLNYYFFFIKKEIYAEVKILLWNWIMMVASLFVIDAGVDQIQIRNFQLFISNQ